MAFGFRQADNVGGHGFGLRQSLHDTLIR
jgi:hypothetical protein